VIFRNANLITAVLASINARITGQFTRSMQVIERLVRVMHKCVSVLICSHGLFLFGRRKAQN